MLPALPKSDYADLMSLVSAQQTRLQSQHAEIKHVSRERERDWTDWDIFQCDNELKYWDGQGGSGPPPGPSSRPLMQDFLPAQLEAVLMEVKMLEDAAIKNEEEIHVAEDGERSSSSVGGGVSVSGGPGIRGELDQLKHRLGGFSL